MKVLYAMLSIWKKKAFATAQISTRGKNHLPKSFALHLYPPKYLNQKSFAEAMAFNAAEDYDPIAIDFITERIFEFNEKKSKFFFFKIAYGDSASPKYLLAGAGPFSTNTKIPSLEDAFGAINEEEDWDITRKEEQMKALIQQMFEISKYREQYVD